MSAEEISIEISAVFFLFIWGRQNMILRIRSCSPSGTYNVWELVLVAFVSHQYHPHLSGMVVKLLNLLRVDSVETLFALLSVMK